MEFCVKIVRFCAFFFWFRMRNLCDREKGFSERFFSWEYVRTFGKTKDNTRKTYARGSGAVCYEVNAIYPGPYTPNGYTI